MSTEPSLSLNDMPHLQNYNLIIGGVAARKTVPTSVEAGTYPFFGGCSVDWRSSQIETVCVHDLGPCGNEVVHELLRIVVLRIDFDVGTQDRI